MEIFGLEGKYKVTPIEYKRGKPKEDNDYKFQLMAQALCLEDMLCCEIPLGYLYYGETKRREKIIFDADLREKTEDIIHHLHGSDYMLVLVTYDVNTQDKEGRKRLRRVAKQCINYGVRVQNSVFECVVDAAQLRKLKKFLTDEIDPEKDSLRFYNLGNKAKSNVEHVGAKAALDVEGDLIF